MPSCRSGVTIYRTPRPARRSKDFDLHARTVRLLSVVFIVIATTLPRGAAASDWSAALSPWQHKLGPAPHIQPGGARAIANTPGGPVRLATTKWSFPVYEIDGSTSFSLEDIHLTEDWAPEGNLMTDVPVPSGVALKPDPSDDGHLAIVDTVHRMEWDFWACALDPDGTWARSTYNARSLFSCRTGDKFYLDSSGTSPIGLSATGSGFALTTGLIRPDEITNRSIKHALGLVVPQPASNGPFAPANKSDGSGAAFPGALPEGARVRLKPDIWTNARINRTHWSIVEKTVAKALRDYGAIVLDGGGSPINLRAENPTYYASPYSAADGMNINAEGAVDLYSPGFFTPRNFVVVKLGQHIPDNPSVDTDGDGIPDAAEVAFGYNPRDPKDASSDTDHDGLTLLQEWKVFDTYHYPTNPRAVDSDHDGFSDVVELAAHTDPTDPFVHP